MDDDEMKKVMGFSNFSGTKKAKQFDFMAMFEATRKTAIERNQNTSCSATKVEVKSEGVNDDNRDKMPNKRGPESSSDDEDEMIGPPVPKSVNATKTDHEDMDDSIKGPPELTTESSKSKDNDSDEELDEEEETEDPILKIPKSHEIILRHSEKPVSALALDPAGSRLVTGSYDYEVKFWDFSGMNASFQSFRTIKPCESHQIKTLDYSCNGEHILVIAGNAQPKVLDRDGFVVFECLKGYQYIIDPANTKGHTGMLNGGCWHPKDKAEFLTCSRDGSVRIWDVNCKGKNHKGVMRTKSKTGHKTFATACCYSTDGRWIAAACQDGSIQIWDHNKPAFVNVAMQNKTAHQFGTDTSGLSFSYDGRTLASRGGDDTLKLWDIRQFQKPLAVAKELENLYPMTDCLFSPDDKLVVTGVSVKRGTGVGKLMFLDRQTLEVAHELHVTEGESVVRCLWHPKLNQIVVGMGDGAAKMYYDPQKSHRGAMLCVVKSKRKAKQVEVMLNQAIIAPYALRVYKDPKPQGSRRRLEKQRKDPVASRRPDLPHSGPGAGGRMADKGATLSQYIVQQIVLTKPDARDKDPRAAILRHAEEAAKNPFYVEPAYSQEQPKIFQPASSNEVKNDDDDEIQPVWKKAKKQ